MQYDVTYRQRTKLALWTGGEALDNQRYSGETALTAGGASSEVALRAVFTVSVVPEFEPRKGIDHCTTIGVSCYNNNNNNNNSKRFACEIGCLPIVVYFPLYELRTLCG